jgi:hypothetical protein
MMFGLTRRGRIGLVAAAAFVSATAGLVAAQAQAPAAEAAQCYERYVSAPINEKGIQCPGSPAIWKSYTFASSGIGYYTETEEQANGRSNVRLGYKHQDGRVAISFMDCGPNGCQETYWNGVPFPFGH